MSITTPETANPASFERPSSAREVYDALMSGRASAERRELAREFLRNRIDEAQHLPCDMPSDATALGPWMERQALEVGEQYARYLESRRAGEPRLYFASRAHAIWYLQRIAPTKLVDGAWLHGTLQRWEDPRFRPLIRTYLEELGDGDPSQNHVLLYRQTLARYGGNDVTELTDDDYLQGAVQLAFGLSADDFFPELLGYNLGYEAIPLHLLITAFELNELDIDPYYFTLHITVDNADSGHARMAVAAVLDALPAVGESETFMRRVADGCRLNEIGRGVDELLASFDLEQEVIAMLERKRVFGQNMHSDLALVDGRTVNQWLEQPGQMGAFLRAMEERGWIKRHQDPEKSRLWQLVEGEGAQMYGVFTEGERQLLHDWIAGDCLDRGDRKEEESAPDRRSRPRVFRRARPSVARAAEPTGDTAPGDPDHGIGDMVRELDSLPDNQRMQRLIELMAPSLHTTVAGLTATRLFRESFG